MAIRAANTEAAGSDRPLPIGFHAFHPDRNINFQLNRALFEGRLEDIEAVATKIRNYADWKREMLAIATAAERDQRLGNAFAYYRAAEFFMALDDPDRDATYQRFMALFDEIHPGLERDLVPYDGGYLPAILVAAHGVPRGTIVLHAGFDAYIEEFCAVAELLASFGFRVIAFDGPGQGTAVHRYHLAMDHAWERPVAAVLDHFRLDEVTLIGISLGGYLAIRAAAFEPRVRRVVAFDVMADFYRCVTSGKGRIAGAVLRSLVRLRLGLLVDAAARTAMRRDLFSAWGLPRAMYLTGTRTPYAMLRRLRRFHTRDCSPLVKQDVLVLAGAHDHFVPVQQFHDQLRWLTAARSVTGRLFTAEEQAAEHCQLGNLGLAIDTIVAWIGERSPLVTGPVTP